MADQEATAATGPSTWLAAKALVASALYTLAGALFGAVSDPFVWSLRIIAESNPICILLTLSLLAIPPATALQIGLIFCPDYKVQIRVAHGLGSFIWGIVCASLAQNLVGAMFL